ncbi:L-seryl-tRNA(Sec) selenium transferase [Thalassorhabdus alkalitolerans]|uniref:L-seryl-tRNA(Sec) selenium transferase n=1 Tax=Thalassorhabdus alkalitolerans TaxID=2282697 RepID=A0ABW0YME0_9BACI
MKEAVRMLPPIHELQVEPEYTALAFQENGVSSEKLTEWLREEVMKLRADLLQGQAPVPVSAASFKNHVLNALKKRVQAFESYTLTRVINATGTILHTNLGRARLSDEAIKQVIMTSSNYSNLEYNIGEGKRGSRHDLIEDLLTEVTGAEAAMVVNNNAAAVFFVLHALAKNKEVIVSRGQLVEIGGSFRVSSIMEESGAHLVEVGTTNKTHLYDYENALNNDTGMIMKVHTSNFKTIGFTAEVGLEELIPLKEKKQDSQVIIYEDLGSGALYDFSSHGIGDEPTVREVIEKGADLVTFSGDKLLGGPQAGIIAGKKEIIQKLKKNQLARVLRVDKMTLAALEATLKAYAKGIEGVHTLPVGKMVLESKEEVKNRAEVFLKGLDATSWKASLIEETSQIGGGTMPDVSLPTFAVKVELEGEIVEKVIKLLRNGDDPPVVARAKGNSVILDFRTVTWEETEVLVHRFVALDQHFH